MNSAAGATTTTDLVTLDNSNDSSGDMDWQSTKCVLRERFEYLFQNGLLCDIQFIVGSGTNIKKIGAHKLVLSAGSVIFFTMFSEKWSADCGTVEIPDVEPPAFVEMLRFLYSDNIMVTPENVSAVIYVARKYSILALENKCVDFLLSNLCVENAFNFLSQGKLFHIQKLVDACLEVIFKNIADTLKTDDFCNIDSETLSSLLVRSDLRVDESEIFDAVLRWSEAACKKEHLPINPENRRHVLGSALSLVRFPLMGPKDFESKVVSLGILSHAETVSVMRYFINKSQRCLFSDEPRRSFHVAHRFSSIVYGGPYGSPSSVHKLLFYPHTAIRLVGIGLYGSPDHSVIYPVDVILHEHDTSRILYQVSGTYDGSQDIFRVIFEKPYTLTAETWYWLKVKIQGEYFRYGCDGNTSVQVNINGFNGGTNIGFVFSTVDGEKFESEKDRGKKTSAFCGQIPEILFEV